MVPGSQAHRIYGKDEATEVFACNYGLNEAFEDQIESNALRVSGNDADGTVRVVELPEHPFSFLPASYLRSFHKPENPIHSSSLTSKLLPASDVTIDQIVADNTTT